MTAPDPFPTPDNTPKKPLPRTVKVLGAVSLLNDTASEMIFPLLPEFLIVVLHGDKRILGLLEGLAETTASLLKLWSGGRSDRAEGRKIFLVVGYALAAITRPLMGLVTGPWQLVSLRIADRFGKGIRSAPRDALIADVTPPDQRGRAFGFHRAMDHVGAMIGPILALVFLSFWPEEQKESALRWLFLLAVIPGLAVLVLLVFGLRVPPNTHEAKPAFTFTRHGFPRSFWMFLAALLLFTLGNSSDAFLLVRAKELGVPTMWLPILWCAFHLVKSVGNVLSGPLVDRLGARPMIVGGWIVYGVIYLLLAWATNAWQMWVLFLGYGVFYALTEPAEKTLVANLVGPERKGLAFGWFNLTLGIGALPASVLFGLLYEKLGAFAAFGTGAILALAASFLLAFFVPKQPR